MCGEGEDYKKFGGEGGEDKCVRGGRGRRVWWKGGELRV